VAALRSEHPKARHVCFGFVAGVNPVQERCSDDGEPTGTAGAPILGKFWVAYRVMVSGSLELTVP
jgi:putative IMPACT (imprinted ancient) family translation regulator